MNPSDTSLPVWMKATLILVLLWAALTFWPATLVAAVTYAVFRLSPVGTRIVWSVLAGVVCLGIMYSPLFGMR